MILIRLLIIFIMLSILSPQSTRAQAERVRVESAWKFREAGGKEWLPATVPGCVHTDLLQNRKIEYPFYRTN